MNSMVSRDFYKTVDQIETVGKSALGKRLEEIGDPTKINTNAGKGKVGDFIEVNLFHIPNDSKAAVDFPVPHVELKVTGAKRDKKRILTAKERLVIDMVNFDVEPSLSSFDESEPWDKIRRMYMMVYEYLYQTPAGKFPIIGEKFFDLLKELPAGDLAQIRRDWIVIRNKLRTQEGIDSLSEGDTIYLAACTKGKNKEDVRHYSYGGHDIVGKRRAFSLKNSYVTYLIEKVLSHPSEPSLFSDAELEKRSFEEILEDRFRPFVGMTDAQIQQKFGLKNDHFMKQSLSVLSSYMAGLHGKKVGSSKQFEAANMDLKTIKVEKDGSIKENLSLPAESFLDAVETDWEDSEIYQHLHMRFLLSIFQSDGEHYVFKGIRFWTMPDRDIERFGKPAYEKFVSVLKTGNIVSSVSFQSNGTKIYHNNFPKTVMNHVVHVRPHAGDFGEQFPLPVPDKVTGMTGYEKQCFWLDKNYLKSAFKDLIK
jgi:DNA mismatch repair protein MutH